MPNAQPCAIWHESWAMWRYASGSNCLRMRYLLAGTIIAKVPETQ